MLIHTGERRHTPCSGLTQKRVTLSRVTNNGTITTVYTGCAESARKRGSMADKNAVFLTRHIGNTTYKVRVYLSETAEETMEDKILRLIRDDGLANQPECGIMELPQMSRPSERSA